MKSDLAGSMRCHCCYQSSCQLDDEPQGLTESFSVKANRIKVSDVDLVSLMLQQVTFSSNWFVIDTERQSLVMLLAVAMLSVDLIMGHLCSRLGIASRNSKPLHIGDSPRVTRLSYAIHYSDDISYIRRAYVTFITSNWHSIRPIRNYQYKSTWTKKTKDDIF